jgi:hypothetical protein
MCFVNDDDVVVERVIIVIRVITNFEVVVPTEWTNV